MAAAGVTFYLVSKGQAMGIRGKSRLLNIIPVRFGFDDNFQYSSGIP